MKIAAFKLAGVALSLSFAWTSAQAAALRVAADPVPHAEILNYIKKIDPSLDLKVVELTSGVNANELLANGDVDANYFQHVPYLKDQEKALGKTFAVAATVHIEPLGIYSRKHKDFASLPENATVAVPNNTTNLSRALFLLQSQGLIKLASSFTDPATTLAPLSSQKAADDIVAQIAKAVENGATATQVGDAVPPRVRSCSPRC